MKYSCYQDCSVIHGWFVYCAFGWKMHRLSKSLEIRFRMASFSKMSLLTCPCSRHKSLKRLWPHLMTFRSSISTGKPEQLLSLMCFFSGFLKSSVVYATGLCTRQWSTIVSGLKRKRFRRKFSYDFGCKKKVLSDFLASSLSLKNRKHREAGLKHK